ncbi:potassium transporter TrkG [Pseudogemmobacter faecipullorum]|uniref:TrkH family potassium uptake protein n=1 Tax=Pseudogemmobacter faecipullorum TaxID=2755041 RepID=A0ABS8CK03_9RHOB|nr:potassium transporter TrkG [Pseudogemmobacter faecipullorum]MCB5409705.1 TrkH family potassium uptake protein [Pseudogemmobacter faecipullorum]
MTAAWREVPLLVQGLGVVAVMCQIPALHALANRDHHTAQGFFYAGIMLLVLTVMLAIATRRSTRRHTVQGQLAALAGAYLLLPLAFAFPLGAIIRDSSWVNLWFEMLSCFSTTGASVYAPERLAPSVHLWRGLVGWLGGFYVLVGAWAVLVPLNLGGAEVISGSIPGHSLTGGRGRSGDPRERLTRGAEAILPVYAGLTLLLWLLLLMAGENGLVALIHAMGTLSTSGVAITGGTAVQGSGLGGEMLMFLFLLFALSRHMMPFALPGHRPGNLLRDSELRLGLFLIFLTTAILLLRHMIADAAAGETETWRVLLRAFWGAMFTAASFLTTTGYESLWWDAARNWAGLGSPGLMLMGLAIVGGGVATTAGGVTLLRTQALWLQGKRELERIIHPHSIGSGRFARRLAQEGARMAWIFFMLFALSVALIMSALTLAGLEFEPALILSIAALTTTGPLAATAGADPIAWAPLSPLVKAILGLSMVLGRLEALALLAIIAPANWGLRWRR